MDNKRKGSTPPRSPSGDNDLEWRAPVPREPAPFEFQDDDDSPLPAPPDFDDDRREAVPELLEGDLSDDDVATPEELEAEEPELLDSALVTEVRPTHRMPPPIPAPVPTGRSSFVDDGEIALPPRITAAPQSFPFRQLQRDAAPAFDSDDDGPALDSAGWRSCALRQRRLGHHPDRRNRHAASLDPEPAMVNSAFFLVLRRMRAPIIVLIVIYAIAIFGLTLVPGVDAEGKASAPLSFFHAFYFISYTATTIGFGEIPNAFSDAQRLWVTICIYLTVVGWSYSVLTLIALLQDKGFQNTLTVNRFTRRVRRLKEPFYLICGCGETGNLICGSSDHLGQAFVVLEKERRRNQW